MPFFQRNNSQSLLVPRGDLRVTPVSSLFAEIANRRQTGTLTLHTPGGDFSVYALFGNIFHATGPGAEGDDVLTTLLANEYSGHFEWDGMAKLPTAESVSRDMRTRLASR